MNEEERLLNKHQGLVCTIVDYFKPANISIQNWLILQEDYKQIGNIGLLHAIRKYNGKNKFSTFAWVCINNEIVRHILQSYKHIYHVSLEELISKCPQIEPHQKIKNNWAECLPPTLTSTELEILQSRVEGYTFAEISYQYNKSNRVWSYLIFRQAVEKIREANLSKADCQTN